MMDKDYTNQKVFDIMKKIIYIITMCLTMGVFSSCTQYNFDDTGLANGKHDMTMWEYFKGDSYNWDSLRVMAERADLVSLSMERTSHSLVLRIIVFVVISMIME